MYIAYYYHYYLSICLYFKNFTNTSPWHIFGLQ